jgi:hypothetical protein
VSFTTATGTGGVLAVPAGVASGDVAYIHYFAANGDGAHPNNGSLGPTGPGDNILAATAYPEGVHNAYEPYLHDGRSEYVWPDSPGTLVAAVFVRGVDAAHHEADNDYSTYAAQVREREWRPTFGDADPMRWDTIQTPEGVPRDSRSLLIANWSARSVGTSTVTIGTDVVAAIGFYEDDLGSFRITYTKAWPGDGAADPVRQWRTHGWIVELAGLPPLRNAQRDDNRGNQRTSRQLSNRNAAYL